MFQGSIVALVTPMSSSGEIDYPCLQRLIDYHVDNGTDAIVVVGTTGEAPTLSIEEQEQVISHAIAQAAGRIPIIAGTGVSSTAKSIESTKRAQVLGVDGCLIVTPYYNRPTQEGLFQHYAAIAEKVSIPILIYNIPSRTGCDISLETVGRLARIENIVGIKDTGNLDRLLALQARTDDSFALLTGDDTTALEFLLHGGHGVVSVTANVIPRTIHRLCQLAASKQISQAYRLVKQIDNLNHKLFVETNPIPVKWVLSEMGLIPSGIRLPLVPLSDAHRPDLKLAMQQALDIPMETIPEITNTHAD